MPCDKRSQGGNNNTCSEKDRGIARAMLVLAHIGLRNRIKAKAASRISAFWRRCQWRSFPRLIKRFAEEGMTKKVKEVTFDELVVMLREKPVIRVTRALMQRLHSMCGYITRWVGSRADTPAVNVRVFLASYLITLKRNNVLEDHTNPLELELYESSKALSECFNKIIEQFNTRQSFPAVDVDSVRSFIPLLMEYLRKFKLWKVPDEAKLTLRIHHALIALYNSQKCLPEDEAPDSRLNVELTVQIERLRSKLVQIAGPENLREFDENRAKNVILPSVDTPRMIDLNFPAGWPVPRENDNERLAHEMLKDLRFQLPESDETYNLQSVDGRVRQQFHNSFWNSLRDDQKVKCYVRVFRVLKEVIDALKEALQGRSNAATIDFPSDFDIDRFKHMLHTGALEISDVVGLVSRIIQGIRDIHIGINRVVDMDAKWIVLRGELQSVTDNDTMANVFTKTLRFLLDNIQKYRIDAANARLRLIAPVIRDHGVDYEIGKFNAKLVGRTTAHTAIYIASAVSKAVTDGHVTLDSLKGGEALAYTKTMEIGFFDFLFDIKNRPIPETLMLDAEIMATLDRNFHVMAFISASFTGFADSLKNNLMQLKGPSDEYNQYVKQCNSDVDDVLGFIYKKIEYCDADLNEIFTQNAEIKLSETALTEEAQKSVLRSAFNVSVKTCPLYKLLHGRIVQIWKKRFFKQAIPEEELGRLGFGKYITQKIILSCDRIRRIYDVNIMVHSGVYNELISAHVRTL